MVYDMSYDNVICGDKRYSFNFLPEDWIDNDEYWDDSMDALVVPPEVIEEMKADNIVWFNIHMEFDKYMKAYELDKCDTYIHMTALGDKFGVDPFWGIDQAKQFLEIVKRVNRATQGSGTLIMNM